MNKISVYIIAYNEEDKIKPAIESVLWADEIILVDSFSKDKTASIAQSMGAKVIQVEFNGFGNLRNQAIDSCKHEWIFSLDADERCTPLVQQEIMEIINSNSAADVYYVPRKNYFMGKCIKYSGYYPDYRQPQLFRKNALTYKDELVHEGFILHTQKKPCYLKNAIYQIPFKNFDEIINKMNRYSSLGAKRLCSQDASPSMKRAFFHGIWAFIHYFIIKKGCLDGWPGFALALSNFESSFYKYAKHYEKTIL